MTPLHKLAIFIRMGNGLHFIFVNETKIVVTVDTMEWGLHGLHTQLQIPMRSCLKNGRIKGEAHLKGNLKQRETYPQTC